MLKSVFCFSVRDAGMCEAVCSPQFAHAHIRRVLRVRRRAAPVLEAGQAVSMHPNDLPSAYLSGIH